MKELPILFSTPMVQAILDGHKTMTRRVIKPQPEFESGYDTPHENELGVFWKKEDSYNCIEDMIADMLAHCPYGQPGDRLWVRETFGYDNMAAFNKKTYFKADNNDPKIELHWKPSIHMPKAAARLWLEVVSVRVERLQEITEDDARAEGIIDGGCLNCGESEPCGCDNPQPDARDGFVYLWNSLNAKRGYGWNINPWVFVVEFKQVTP